MNHQLLRSLSAPLAALALHHAAPAADSQTPAIDYAARLQSVANLKQHIAQREQRFQALANDLRGLDDRVEKQIDYIVTTLSGLKDSTDSKTSVAQLKGEVIDGLRRTITIYRQKRMDLFERMRKEQTVPEEELAKTLQTFDDRIGKRIDQVTTLIRSLPGHKDVPKYETDGSSYANGWYDETTRVSEDWKQNRRQSNASEVERREALQAIQKGIDNANSRRASIADALANRKLSDQERQLQQAELGRIDATIDRLRTTRREIALPSGEATQAVGNDEIHDVSQLVDDARADLSRDFSDIFRKYSDLDRERSNLFALKANLKAREEWLKNNPPPKE